MTYNVLSRTLSLYTTTTINNVFIQEIWEKLSEQFNFLL